MIRRPPRSTQSRSSAASDVYKRQVLQQGQLLGELPQVFLAVGQFGPHALVGDQRADGKMPCPLASGLLLAVAGGGDASGKFRVGVKQGHGDAGASGHRREADRLAALLESVDGLGGPLALDPAIGPSGAAQCRAVVSHRWCPACLLYTSASAYELLC